MSTYRTPGRAALLVSLVVFLLAAAVGGFAQAIPAPVNGTIAAIDGNTITLTLADKTQKTVVLRPSSLILQRETSSLDAIVSGVPLGVTSRRDGMKLVALSINIFSPEMWAANPRKTEFVMTTGNMMTNALVTSFSQGMNGHTLSVKYTNGTSSITVPDGIPVWKFVDAKRASLAVGMQVSVRGSPGSDGTITAGFVSFDGPAKS